ncbi:MAG: pantetheine-phosphate adenylyltransferase [bacterium]
MKQAVYPGSFDPVTYGHLDIITRASALFDGLIVAVANNPLKTPTFSLEDRKKYLEEVTKDMPNVQVMAFSSLLVDFLKEINVNIVVRGLRAVTDFEMEFQMALVNKNLLERMETVFLVTRTEYSFLSSSIIKEVAAFGGEVSDFVPPIVEEGLMRKFRQRT